ncbi:MAG TPA: MerR family DNA-binding transcriptional regulator, partial [Patescibacteria group bacterium]|nr:MerR family DNA-binding transcriptional regulator [Patescibacteria group bacterium]
MFIGQYRLHDITRKIDRDKSTIIRWEKQGLIPKARRDSRGWRYYTIAEAEKIIALARKTNYFQSAKLSTDQAPAETNFNLGKLSYGFVAGAIIFILYSLFSLG